MGGAKKTEKDSSFVGFSENVDTAFWVMASEEFLKSLRGDVGSLGRFNTTLKIAQNMSHFVFQFALTFGNENSQFFISYLGMENRDKCDV